MLFPARSDMRIPVTPVFYEYMATCYPCTATQFQERADASSLVAALSTLLDPEYTKFFTGQTSSHLIVEFVAKVFSSLRHWSTQRVRCSIRLNSTEPCRADCGGTFSRLRPDTMVAMDKCTLLIGEDNWDQLQLAVHAPMQKRQELDAAFYGQLRFLLAYAAAGKEFQWFWMCSNGKVSTVSMLTAIFGHHILAITSKHHWPAACNTDSCGVPCGTLPSGSQPILFVLLRMQVEEVGRTLDLTHEQDRIELVLTLARAYFLAVVMVKSAPRLDERPTLYSTILRGSVGREKDRYTGALISAF